MYVSIHFRRNQYQLPVSSRSARRGSLTRLGTTLVELLVVLAITSLLMGLLLPAIQSSREAARANDCRSRLRQLAIAAHGFHETHGNLPVTFHVRIGQPAFPDMLSAWAQLLPYLDQGPLFQQIDQDPTETGLGAYNSPPSLSRPVNQQILKTSLPIVTCPSDSAPIGGCNYRVCRAAGPSDGMTTGGAWGPNGVDRKATFGQITDGLSQTAFISERVVGDMDINRFTPARDVYVFAVSPPYPYDADVFAQACRTQFRSPLPGELSYIGATWLVNGYSFTQYNHVLTPNAAIPDCTFDNPGLHSAAATARSWHPHGVHVAFADGHVRRIAENIDLKVWRAMATRQGGEVLQSSD